MIRRIGTQICLLVFAVLSFYAAASAEIREYELSWTGKFGYKVVGSFAFDNSKNYGYIIDETELKAFRVTAYTPDGKALKTYTLKNQNRFNFNFDLKTETILQARNASSSSEDGFSVGEIAGGDSRKLMIDDPAMYVFTGFLGCGGSFPRSKGPELLVSNGSCKGYSLDYGGTKITAKLIKKPFSPSSDPMPKTEGELYDETVKLDKELNRKSKELESRLDKEKFKQLKGVQQQWIHYRDDLCKFEKMLESKDENWIKDHIDGDQSLSCIYRMTNLRLKELDNYQEIIRKNPIESSASRNRVRVENCKFANLPSEFEVYGVGVYKGLTATEYQLGDSGHEVKEVEVIVNKPKKQIVLVLMAYDPVVWKIHQTPESHILGVVVGGYHTQALLGIRRETPSIFAVHEEKSVCKYFCAHDAGKSFDNALIRIRDITGSDLKKFINKPIDNKIYVGSYKNIKEDTLLFSQDMKIEDYLNPAQSPVGQRGLDLLVTHKKIRVASQGDIDAWIEKASLKYKKYNSTLKIECHMHPNHTYVVMDDFELPNGLFGAHSRAFIIPKGKNMPTGPKCHNSFYFMANGQCKGAAPECNR